MARRQDSGREWAVFYFTSPGLMRLVGRIEAERAALDRAVAELTKETGLQLFVRPLYGSAVPPR